MKLVKVAIGLTWIAALASCANSVEVVELLNRKSCNEPAIGVSLVDLEELARLRSSQLIGAKSASGEAEDWPPLIVAVSKGPQPTSGYGFQFHQASVDAGTITVNLLWQQPEADSMQAQIVTTPCIVLGLPRSNNHSLKVQDQLGPIGELTF